MRFLYGIGDIPNAVKTTLAGLFGLYFYTSVMGVSGTLVGIAGAIGLLWDACIDQYIGHLSDVSRARFGRRHAFMLAGALTMGVGFWASFSPPRGLSEMSLFCWILGTGFVVRTATSAFRVPYFALGAELASDYDQRTQITGLRGMLALAGTLAAASLAFGVFLPDRASGVQAKLDADAYRLMGLIVGAMMTAFALLTTLGTLSAGDHRPAPAAETRHPLLDFLAGVSQSLRSPSFRVLLISVVFAFMAVAVNGSLALHFLTHYAGITGSAALGAFQLSFYVASVVGIGVWLRVSRRWEKGRLFVLGMLGMATVLVATFLLLGEGRPLGMGNGPAVAVIHILGGFFGSVIWFLPATMIADVVDESELATWERREGAFFGCFSLGQQIAFGLSMLVTGILLDRFAGLVPGEPIQSAQTVQRIGVLYCLFPAALLLLAGVSMMRYRLDRQRVRTLQVELGGRTENPAAGSGRGSDSLRSVAW